MISLIGKKRESENETKETLIRRHAEDVKRILGELVRQKPVASMRKAQLFSGEVEFFGHVL